ncbi:peptide deformylase [Candidatus Parcubacteria bacterium]|nr:peptide deformylase [Candidatus Parcubacteria bacterium]
MARLLQIAQIGSPILRQQAQEVPSVHDPAIQTLIEDMMATCEEADGVGIAAPQVYSPFRVIIVASKPSPRYPNAPMMKPMAMINPNMEFIGDEMEEDWEGCLSIPGLRGKVRRAKRIGLAYRGPDGFIVSADYDGFVARIVQHEIDHLNGTMFVDRADPKSFASEKEYQRVMKEEQKRREEKV